jgi:hypothetical protein
MFNVKGVLPKWKADPKAANWSDDSAEIVAPADGRTPVFEQHVLEALVITHIFNNLI